MQSILSIRKDWKQVHERKYMAVLSTGGHCCACAAYLCYYLYFKLHLVLILTREISKSHLLPSNYQCNVDKGLTFLDNTLLSAKYVTLSVPQ